MPRLNLTPRVKKYCEKRLSSVLVAQADYKSLFNPVADIIIDLIDDQVSPIAKEETASQNIVLVRRFRSSPYVRNSIAEWCKERDIRLTTPISGA